MHWGACLCAHAKASKQIMIEEESRPANTGTSETSATTPVGTMHKVCLLVGLALVPAIATYAEEASTAIPAGAVVVVRTIDAIDSKKVEIGKTFRATLETPLVVKGQELARKGAEATLRVIHASDAGKFKGNAELTVSLVSVNTGAGTLTVNDSTVSMQTEGKGKKSLFKIGGGAAAGAAIGGILGGRKGAATGAGAGAGAGAAAAMLTGPQVKIPSETLLTFKVQ